MPHLTMTAYTDKRLRISFWRSLRQALRQRLNVVVEDTSVHHAKQVQRTIHRFVLREGLPCLVTQRGYNVLILFF